MHLDWQPIWSAGVFDGDVFFECSGNDDVVGRTASAARPLRVCFHYPSNLSTQSSPEKITAGFAVGAAKTWCSSDEVCTSIRGLLRQSGFKPTGRNKPASEYLVKAATNGKLHSINLAVDACNVVSLQSGLPISVVDTRHLTQPLTVGVASEKSEYVFNSSGQVLY